MMAVVLLTCFVALMSATGAGREQKHEKKHDVKKQVEALEEQWRKAQLAGDVATMESMLSDDFIGISMSGQVNTKAQQLDRMRTRKLVRHQNRPERHEGEAGGLRRDCDLPGRGGRNKRRRFGEGDVSLHAGLSASAVGGVEDHQL